MADRRGMREGQITRLYPAGHGANLVEGFFSKMTRSMLRHIRVASKAELKNWITAYLDDLSRDPVMHSWIYKIGHDV
jgi:hypothetical protein